MQDLLLSYYGDDLTGSTDVMEALELGGVPTVLFMRQPDEAQLAQFAHCRAVGLAGGIDQRGGRASAGARRRGAGGDAKSGNEADELIHRLRP